MAVRVQRFERFDLGDLGPPRRSANGTLIVDARLARTGVQVYRRADGTTRREYRPDSEVFAPATLDSFADAIVTDDHPPVAITGANAREYQRGHVRSDVKRDGEFVRATLAIHDGALIERMQAGKRQLSAGYAVELDETPGVAPDGQHYDAVQRSIVVNHAAIVTAGRAGPAVSVRMDAGDAVAVDRRDAVEERGGKWVVLSMGGKVLAGCDTEAEARARMAELEGMQQMAGDSMEARRKDTMKIKLDGLEVDLAAEVASAIEKERAASASQLAAATGRADSLAKQLEAETKARKDAEDPKALAVRVAARVALEVEARKHLGADTRLDELADRAIRAAVIEKLEGEPVPNRSDEYLAARFDSAIKHASRAALGGVRQLAAGIAPIAPARPTNAMQAYAERQRDAWKEKE